MSRAHTQGFDSNAGQFSRMGNPWDGEPVLKTQARKARRKAGIAPCRSGLPRLGERDSRNDSEAFEDLKCRRRIAAMVAAASGNSRCHVAKPVEKPRPAPFIRPDARTELEPFHPERLQSEISRLEREATKARIEAKLALGNVKAAAEIELGSLAL
jgi:hypothetical protein